MENNVVIRQELLSVIPGNKNYIISTFGTVISLVNKPLIIRPDTSADYLRVTLCQDNSKIRQSCHRLVAMTFIPNPENKPCVNHKNGIKRDNFIDNLEWVTYSENSLHASHTGLMPITRPFLNKKGSFHHRSKKIIQMTEDGDPIKTWDSACVASDNLRIPQSNISKVCIGERKMAGGFKWKFA